MDGFTSRFIGEYWWDCGDQKPVIFRYEMLSKYFSHRERKHPELNFYFCNKKESRVVQLADVAYHRLLWKIVVAAFSKWYLNNWKQKRIKYQSDEYRHEMVILLNMT